MNAELIATAFGRITQIAGKALLFLTEHAPEIAIGAGAVGMTVAGVTAVINTEAVVDAKKEMKETIAKTENHPGLDEHEKTVDIHAAKRKYRRKFVKAYFWSFAAWVLSLTSIAMGTAAMAAKIVTLVTEATAIQQSFDLYRKRVVEDAGEDKDMEYMTGVKRITEVDADTGEVITRRVGDTSTPIANPYSFIISKYTTDIDGNVMRNPLWNKDKHIMLMNIKGALMSANQAAWAKGWLNLADLKQMFYIYDLSPIDFDYGWRMKKDNKHGDNKISLGIDFTSLVDFIDDVNNEIGDNDDYCEPSHYIIAMPNCDGYIRDEFK